MSLHIEIRQFGQELARFPSYRSRSGEMDEIEYNMAADMADTLHRHGRVATGYYEVVLVGPIGDSGLVGELDSMEAVA